MTKTQNPFIAAEWIRRAVNQDYIEDNLVEYDWILAQDEALAARILELASSVAVHLHCIVRERTPCRKEIQKKRLLHIKKQRM